MVLDGLTPEYKERLIERFWANVDKRGPDECWLWIGAIKNDGYGAISITYTRGKKGTTLGAHRISYELHNNPIVPGMCVCHSCDVRPCVNPRHLFQGTYGDNMADKALKGRAAFKLTEENVRYIRKASAAGVSRSELGRMFNVSRVAIYFVVTGKIWKHHK
jgi:hypothetical protein